MKSLGELINECAYENIHYAYSIFEQYFTEFESYKFKCRRLIEALDLVATETDAPHSSIVLSEGRNPYLRVNDIRYHTGEHLAGAQSLEFAKIHAMNCMKHRDNSSLTSALLNIIRCEASCETKSILFSIIGDVSNVDPEAYDIIRKELDG